MDLMIKSDNLENFSEQERKIIDKLSAVVEIVGAIYLKQKNQACPAGNLYPPDITREEFDQAAIRNPELKRFDTVVERLNARHLVAVPYNEKYREEYFQIKKLVAEARDLASDEPFRRYLESLVSCLTGGTVESYWQMMTEWVRTKEYAINFPFTYDEPYMDRLVGIKGGFNAGIFLKDEALTATITRLLGTLEDFKRTLVFPAPPKLFPKLQAAVYRTVKHEGMMAEMELRAWNLPNDLRVRETVGARQTIIKEGQERACLQQAWPIAQEVFPEAVSQISRDKLLAGFFTVAMMHEISHNIARYEKENDLEKYFSVFEELKAYLLPILWIDFLTQKKIFTKQTLESRLKSGLISQEQYDKGVAKADAELDRKKRDLAVKQAKRDKAIGIMNATLNTALAILKIWAEVPKGDFAISTIALTAVAAAIGASQIATIAAQPLPTAARGGMIGGKKHAQGGTMIEAEQGEAIINATSMGNPRLRELASLINEAGGGVPFVKGRITPTSDGGYYRRNSDVTSRRSFREMGEIISDSINRRKTYVTVEDIRRADISYTEVETINKNR